MNSMPTPPTAYDETAKGPGLSGLLEIVRRRRVLAVLPFLFVLTAAVSLAVFLPSLWTSRALVLVNRQAIPERYVTPTVQADIEARLLTLSQDILTPQRLTQIAQQYGLYRGARSVDDLVDRMRKDIRIELVDDRDRRTRETRPVLFTVSYTASNPSVAMTSPGGSGLSVTPADTAAARLNLLRQELAMAQTRFSDKYPDVVQLKEQIRVLEQKVETEKQAAQALPKSVAHASKRGAGGRALRTPPENAYVQSLMTQLDQATVEAKTTSDEMQNINAQIATA